MLVATGDCSIKTAAANGNIRTVKYMDGLENKKRFTAAGIL
ncbi:MAG: hypothetical protein COT38_01760 [Candidatus Omnitrophica bacterium CG08_land_8_20_14_0_20_41_16]|uniref:Uncharacterized protein n=1 Tax=Candidatus Sherwoodlollariibacterium unditelluris TaxID=1974757 RepID=A0A2G9YL43_9BACT|nr:MAG: hypothetical protein COX41_03890 [Candidatus Omnitrophica bacterium CG23_combo_of_CG06-09_8_20_14_all_41_10]PIS34076.1 MAG: hypothetical protein COT38_01760 [Candidatus Omnitrophica bacterium CG08_land_8_20_14_0_20_41_16]